MVGQTKGDHEQMRFSCITTTFRYGGVDILTESLSRQNFNDFECIFIDELYNERKVNVNEYMKEQGIWEKVIHIPPKQRDCERRIGMQNGRNSGLLLAEGDYVVQLDDYTILNPDAFKMFNKLHHEHPNDVLLAMRRLYNSPNITDNKGLITTYSAPFKDTDGLSYEEVDVFDESQGVVKIDQIVSVLNLGCIPLDALIKTGGYDERYDAGHGLDDADIMYRMFQYGKDAWMDTENINGHIRHQNQPTPTTNKNAEFLKKRIENWTVHAQNNYDIQELRSKFLDHKESLREGEEVKSLPLQW